MFVATSSRLGRLFTLALLALLTAPAQASWTLDNGSSRLSFVMTKNHHIGEVSRFYNVLGGVSDNGKVLLRVDMDSLRTGVLLQDQRLHKELFTVSSFPYADIKATLDLTPITNLAPGAQMELVLPLTLRIQKVEQDFMADLLVTRLDEHRFQVVTQAPLVLDASTFELTARIDSLRQLAGLQQVSLSVPVSAVLIFIRN